MSEPNDPSRFLRLALRGNGIFSAISGLSMFIADGLIAALLGAYEQLGEIHIVGANLLAFAALLFYVASRDRMAPGLVMAIIGADLLWVVGSWAAMAAGLVTGQGFWAVAIVADVVLLFAILQWIGLRRSQPAPATT